MYLPYWTNSNIKRNRKLYIWFIILTMCAGLASRKFSDWLPNFLSLYLGDTLWALLVFLLLGFIWAQKSSFRIGVAALLFAYAIEFSQCYHAPWIDQIRDTTFGGLILGYGFLWSDLICYTVGIFLGVILELF